MALRAPSPHVSPEAYLAAERVSDAKREYLDGDVLAMTGGSYAHSLVASNILGALHAALRDGPCEAHGPDLRVGAADRSFFAYPDVTVLCGAPAFVDDAADTVTNPLVVVEVLSPSTEAFDRGEKFARYRRLPSLRAYVLVAQDRRRVEWYARGDAGWLLHEAGGPDGAIGLEALGVTIPLGDVYARVPLDPPSG